MASASSKPRFWVGLLLVLLTCMSGCGRKATPLEEASRLLYEDEYDQATAICDSLLAADSLNYDALLMRGQVNQERGEVSQALEDYSQAIKANPQHWSAWDYRGNLYLELSKQSVADGDAERSVAFQDAYMHDYRKAKELDPAAAIAYPDERLQMPKSTLRYDLVSDPRDEFGRDARASDELGDDDLSYADDLSADDPFAVDGVALPQSGGEASGDQVAGVDKKAGLQKAAANQPKTSAEELLKQQADARKKIEELDLEPAAPGELTLPPHQNDENQLAAPEWTPPPAPTYNFGIPLGEPLPGVAGLPQPPRRSTTGFTPPSPTGESNGKFGGSNFGAPSPSPGRYSRYGGGAATGLSSTGGYQRSIPTQSARTTGIVTGVPGSQGVRQSRIMQGLTQTPSSHFGPRLASPEPGARPAPLPGAAPSNVLNMGLPADSFHEWSPFAAPASAGAGQGVLLPGLPR